MCFYQIITQNKSLFFLTLNEIGVHDSTTTCEGVPASHGKNLRGLGDLITFFLYILCIFSGHSHTSPRFPIASLSFSSCLFTRARKKNTQRRSWRSWTLRENCFGTFQREGWLSHDSVSLLALIVGLFLISSVDTVCTRTTALVSLDTTSKTLASSGGTSPRPWF